MIKNQFPLQHVSKLKRNLPQRDFLIVGKGPSLKGWSDSFHDQFNVVGINHVAEKLKTTIGHFTDYETFSTQKWLSPNVIVSGMMNQQLKTTVTLPYLIQNNLAFADLYKSNRVYTYDIRTDAFDTNLFAMRRPLVFKYASGVLLTQVAIIWNLSRMYTLGIDGGTNYHHDFSELRGNGLFLNDQITLMNEFARNNSLEIIKM